MSSKSVIGAGGEAIRKAAQEEEKRRQKQRAQQRKNAPAAPTPQGSTARSTASGGAPQRSQSVSKTTVTRRQTPPRVTPGVSGPLGQPTYTPIHRGWSDTLTAIGQGVKRLQSVMDLPAQEDAISGKLRQCLRTKDETDEYASTRLLDGESTVSAYKQWVQVQMAPPGERRPVAELEQDPGFRAMRKMLFPQIAAIIDGKSVPLTADQEILHSLYTPGSDEQAWERQMRQRDRASGQPWQDEGTEIEQILEKQRAATGHTNILAAQEELLNGGRMVPAKQSPSALSAQQQQQAAQVSGRDLSAQTQEERKFRLNQREQSREDQTEAAEKAAQGRGDLSAQTAREIDQKQRQARARELQENTDRAEGNGDLSVHQFHDAALDAPKIRADQPGTWESLIAQQWAADAAAGNELSDEDRQARLQGEYNLFMRRFTQGDFAGLERGQDGYEGEGPLENKLLKLDFDPAYVAFYEKGGVRENLQAQMDDANTRAQGHGDLSAGMGLDYAKMGTPEYDANKAYYVQAFGANGERFGKGSRYLRERHFNQHDGRSLDDYLANEYAGYKYEALPEFVKGMIWWERMFADDSYGTNIGVDAAISNQMKNTIALGIGVERTGVQFAQSVVSIVDAPLALVNWIGKINGWMDPDTKTLLEDAINQLGDCDRYLQEELVPEGYGNVSSVTALIGNVVLDYLMDAGITKITDSINKVKTLAVAADEVTDLVKTTDEVTDLVKTTDRVTDLAKVTDEVTDLAKVTDEVTDLAKVTDEVTDLAKVTDEVTDLAKVTDEVTDLAKVTDAAQDTQPIARALAKIAEGAGENQLDVYKALAIPDRPYTYLGDIPIPNPYGGRGFSIWDLLSDSRSMPTQAERIIRSKDALMSFADGYSYAVEHGQDEQTRLLYGLAGAQANRLVDRSFELASSTANAIGQKVLKRNVILGLDQAVETYGPGIVPLFHTLSIMTDTGKTILSDQKKDKYYQILDRFLGEKP